MACRKAERRGRAGRPRRVPGPPRPAPSWSGSTTAPRATVDRDPRPRRRRRSPSGCSANRASSLARLRQRRGRWGGRGRFLASRFARAGALVALRREPGHEVRVARALDHRVELGAVVADQADALDADVVDGPAAVLEKHAVVDRDFGPLLRHDACLGESQVAFDRIAGIQDLLAGVALDLRDVRVLQEVAEERDELLLLGGRARLPVPAEAALGDLAEVEDLVDDSPYLFAALGGLGFLLELGVGDDLQDEVDGSAELVGGHAGGGIAGYEERQQGRDNGERAHHSHLIPRRGPKSLAGRPRPSAPSGAPIRASHARIPPGVEDVGIPAHSSTLASDGGAPAPRRPAARTLINARLGRRGPSPATSCGSHTHQRSPRTAGPQPRDVLRLA